MSVVVKPDAPAVVVKAPDTRSVVVRSKESVVVSKEAAARTVFVVRGVPGPAGDASGAFLVSNRFFEIAADEVAKQTARTNLGLSTIDGGEFF